MAVLFCQDVGQCTPECKLALPGTGWSGSYRACPVTGKQRPVLAAHSLLDGGPTGPPCHTTPGGTIHTRVHVSGTPGVCRRQQPWKQACCMCCVMARLTFLPRSGCCNLQSSPRAGSPSAPSQGLTQFPNEPLAEALSRGSGVGCRPGTSGLCSSFSKNPFQSSACFCSSISTLYGLAPAKRAKDTEATQIRNGEIGS